LCLVCVDPLSMSELHWVGARFAVAACCRVLQAPADKQPLSAAGLRVYRAEPHGSLLMGERRTFQWDTARLGRRMGSASGNCCNQGVASSA